jgi:hypothetical protein
MMHVLSTDDPILADPCLRETWASIKQMKNVLKLDITVKGDLSDFLGVNFD